MPQNYPLTHFEELVLHQDRTAFPASCFLRLRFQGRLNRTSLQTAVGMALQRHPLLRSTVVRNRRRYHWVVGPVVPDITWVEGCERFPPSERLDLRQRPGLRVIVRRDAERSEILLQFHHACCDGVGSYQFVRDLLVAYGLKFDDEPARPLPKLDDKLLAERECLGFRLGELLRMVVHQAARLPAAVMFFVRTPPPLVAHEPRLSYQSVPDHFPGLRAHHFDRESSAIIRQAIPIGTTINDVLTRDLFLSLRDFRTSRPASHAAQWLRLMIPMNLRRKAHRRTSAANIMGAVFLERRGVDMIDSKRLLQGISREMNVIKRLQLGYLFLFALFAQRWLPGGLRAAACPERCQVTTVFTNLGKVLTRGPGPRVDGQWQCGNVILETTEPAAPVTRKVPTTFSASWYASRLTIVLHYDAGVLSARQAQSMLALYVRQIQDSAGLEPLYDRQPEVLVEPTEPSVTDAVTS